MTRAVLLEQQVSPENGELEKNLDFEIIQGGMGFGVSNYEMAGEVAKKGELGVVSIVGSGMLLARGLQDGGKRAEDSINALRDFPNQELAQRIIDRYHKPNGRELNPKTGLKRMYIVPPKLDLGLRNGEKVVNRHAEELNLLGAYAEVKMAKHIAGGNGKVGVNLLEKIQETTLSALYGAMLADVDVVIMGAGIPKHVPKIIDNLSNHESVHYPLDVEQEFFKREGETEEEFVDRIKIEKEAFSIFKRNGLFDMPFNPSEYVDEPIKTSRPKFLAIVSSDLLARMLATKTEVPPDGFIVELPIAGGHNANPRVKNEFNDKGEPVYGKRDDIDYEKLRSYGLPFWMAGGYGDPDGLLRAKELGAEGIQVGSLFALSKESGINNETKRSLIDLALSGAGIEIFTSPRASPTGFAFKVVQQPGTISENLIYEERARICDLGYLRKPFATIDSEGSLLMRYRCPSEPIDDYLDKGGTLEETVGRNCVCNGLAATIGMPQVQRNKTKTGVEHNEEHELITLGNSAEINVIGIHTHLGRLATNSTFEYSSSEAVDYLKSSQL